MEGKLSHRGAWPEHLTVNEPTHSLTWRSAHGWGFCCRYTTCLGDSSACGVQQSEHPGQGTWDARCCPTLSHPAASCAHPPGGTTTAEKAPALGYLLSEGLTSVL